MNAFYCTSIRNNNNNDDHDSKTLCCHSAFQHCGTLYILSLVHAK